MADNTAFQANFKLADGTLINIYAADAASFETQLVSVQDLATLIHSVSGTLGSAGPTGAIKRAFPGAQVVSQTPAPAAPAVDGSTPACKHGAMVFKEGVSQRGPWRAWMCSAPKGAPDKCEPNFIR